MEQIRNGRKQKIFSQLATCGGPSSQQILRGIRGLRTTPRLQMLFSLSVLNRFRVSLQEDEDLFRIIRAGLHDKHVRAVLADRD